MSSPDPREQSKQLAAMLGLRNYQAAGLIDSLRLLAEDTYPIGHFPNMTAPELAAHLLFPDSTDRLVAALCELGILEKLESGFQVPDWTEDDPGWFKHSSVTRQLNIWAKQWQAEGG